MALELNLGEYGQILRINFSQDISTATALSFELQPKFGDSVEKTDSTGVSVGTSNVDVGDSTYLANEYLQYTTEDGDIDQSGQWRFKGMATLSGTEKLVSDYEFIQVLE